MNIEDDLKKITQDPGVYLFYNKYDQIIYIGKAKSLRSRVRSYWNKSCWKDRPKLGAIVPNTVRLETIITKSEKEALILESNLVFKHQPKYNVLLKANDKFYPWLVITYDEAYPRLIPVRDIEKFKESTKGRNSKNKFFGPYTNISAMYENLNLVNELFPLRKKRVPPFRDRPCLNYFIGKCLGPCQKLISEEDYHKMLQQVEILLKGNHRELEEMLRVEMLRYSDNQEYEKAAKIRDSLAALQTFNESQSVISANHKLDQDVFALVTDQDRKIACIQIFKTRSGRLINRETIEIEFESQDKDSEIFESAFEQYYAQVPDTELVNEILISHELESIEVYADWLSERKGQKVKITKPQRGDKLEQVHLAKRNARVVIEKIKLDELEEASKNINIALANLRTQLDMRTDPARIECFDISHIQGHLTVASMVCFLDGMPAKNEYRRYKLSIDQNDDFASMREVVFRRYKSADPENLPNLIIIDGGKGQLNAAAQVLTELGFTHIKIVSLAKKEEEIFFPNESKPLILDRKSPELFLVQRIRNEAHRFAITYHRKLRSKKSLRSKLEDIPGLGPAKRKLLMKEFSTISKIKEASLEELASLRGFNTELAQRIKSIF